jgi:hypothetical protein
MDGYIASSSPALFSKRSSKREVQFDVKQTTDFSDYGSGLAIFITMMLPEYKCPHSEVFTEPNSRGSDKGFLASQLKYRSSMLYLKEDALYLNTLHVTVR